MCKSFLLFPQCVLPTHNTYFSAKKIYGQFAIWSMMTWKQSSISLWSTRGPKLMSMLRCCRLLTENWLERMRLSYSDVSNTILSNFEQTQISFFKHRTNSIMFIYRWSDSNTLYLAPNEQTSKVEPNRVFTRFTNLPTEKTWTSYFWPSNTLECVFLLVIELKQPILGFE